MKWRNLISYRDRLYTSNANIDVFELWTIWFVITKWKLEMGMSADCGDHVQICAIIALYIFPAWSMMNASFPFSFYRFFFIVTPRTREYESSDRLLFIVSLHFSLRRPSLIFENASLRTDYSYRFFTFFIPFNVSYSIILTRFVVPIQIHSFKIRAKVGSTWYGRYQSTFLHDFYRVKCVPHRGEYLAIMFHSISMKEDLKKKNTLRALFLAWC